MLQEISTLQLCSVRKERESWEVVFFAENGWSEISGGSFSTLHRHNRIAEKRKNPLWSPSPLSWVSSQKTVVSLSLAGAPCLFRSLCWLSVSHWHLNKEREGYHQPRIARFSRKRRICAFDTLIDVNLLKMLKRRPVLSLFVTNKFNRLCIYSDVSLLL